mgnify:CR=1 FL=1
MGYAQGPHGGVMGGVASGKSEAEVSAANEGERNANALAAAVKSILSSKEYRALIEKEWGKNKNVLDNVLDSEIQALLDENLKAQQEATKQAIEGGFYSSSYDVSPSAVIGAYKDDPLDGLKEYHQRRGASSGGFDTNFNLNIGAPAGSSPGFQGAVTPGVSPLSVSHDFEGLIGQQENEAEEGLRNALGVGLGFNKNYTQAPHALDVIEQQNIAKKFNEEEFGLPVLDETHSSVLGGPALSPTLDYKESTTPITIDIPKPSNWGKKDFKSLKELDKKEEALKDALGVGKGLSPSKTNREKYEAYLKTFVDWAEEQREKITKETDPDKQSQVLLQSWVLKICL